MQVAPALLLGASFLVGQVGSVSLAYQAYLSLVSAQSTLIFYSGMTTSYLTTTYYDEVTCLFRFISHACLPAYIIFIPPSF